MEAFGVRESVGAALVTRCRLRDPSPSYLDVNAGILLVTQQGHEHQPLATFDFHLSLLTAGTSSGDKEWPHEREQSPSNVMGWGSTFEYIFRRFPMKLT